MTAAHALHRADYPLEMPDEQSCPSFSSPLTSLPKATRFAVPDFSAHALPTAPGQAWPNAQDASPDASSFDIALLAAAADPAVANELEFLRTQTLNNFLIAIGNISASLSAQQNTGGKSAGATPTPGTGPIDVRSLRAALGGGASAGRQQMELAEQLAIGALVNLDNPDWDPANPPHNVDTSQNTLFAFLSTRER